MSNVFHEHNIVAKGSDTPPVPYFQVPKAIIEGQMLAKMKPTAWQLYAIILYEAQQQSRIEIELRNEDIQQLTGMSTASIAKAREELDFLGLIRFTKGRRGVYTYTVCSPATTLPLERRKRRRAEKAAGGNRKRSGRSISDWTAEEHQRYYEHYVGPLDASKRDIWQPVLCPLHDDSLTKSLNIKLATGTWHCHGGCNDGGGVLKFEIAANKWEDVADAYANIARIMDDPELAVSVKPEAVYLYTDEKSQPLYRKLRFPGKEFRFEGWDRKKGRWTQGLEGIERRVLYHLPDVLRAAHVVLCEGEKDADNVQALGLIAPDGTPFACTSASTTQWREEYTRTLTGKKVLIFGDDDDRGHAYVQEILQAITGHAQEVKIVTEWGHDVKDVTDYLQTHDAGELIAHVDPQGEWIQAPVHIEP